jgi:hypothetical protein
MENFKIKPELLAQWKEVCGINSCDAYSFGVQIAACASFEILDRQGSKPQDAIQVWGDRKLDLTGFMAGEAARIIARFHERGDEFRIAWNARYGVDEEKAKGGTVNPAIVTIPE